MKKLIVTYTALGKLKHVPLDRDLEQMLISAERYACGRMSYVVGDTIRYITFLIPHLSEWCIKVMVNDIQSEIDMCERSGGKVMMGMESDHAAWLAFKEKLDGELKRRANDACSN